MNETLGPYIWRYLDERRRAGMLAPQTARRCGYRLHRLSTAFGARPLNHLNPRYLAEYVTTLDGMAVGTRRLHISTIRGFCHWLVDTGVIKADPTAKLRGPRKPRRLPRALPADQVAKILAGCQDPRVAAIVALMVGCGLRCAEVAGAQLGDYDRTARTLRVVGKGGHERVLPIPEATTVAVSAYLNGAPQVAGPLIRSKTNPAAHLTPLYISRLVGAAMVTAGVKHAPRDGVSAHALRHSAATDVLEHSGDLRAVQQMLGHANLATTSIYLGTARLDQLREAMEGRSYRVVPSAATAVTTAGVTPALPDRGNR